MKKDKMTDDPLEVWSAIRYLDPDENHSPANAVAVIIVLALALLICMVLIEIHLRGL